MNTTVYADIREMKKYALDNKVPIMQDDGIDFLTTFVVKHQINSVLEIGTANVLLIYSPFITRTSTSLSLVTALKVVEPALKEYQA